MKCCKEMGITVTKVPGYSTDSVAELAIGLAISVLRQIPLGNDTCRNGGWNKIKATGKVVR